MPKSCCSTPIGRIIRVGSFEAGIIGLDEMLKRVATAAPANEEELKKQLLLMAREYGNYIGPGAEVLYKEALLRELRIYSKKQRKVDR